MQINYHCDPYFKILMEKHVDQKSHAESKYKISKLVKISISKYKKKNFTMLDKLFIKVFSDLSQRDPGTLIHARWVTSENIMWRLYISSEGPSKNLVHIVTFTC